MAQHDRFTISAADHGVDHITQCEFHLGVGMIGRAVLDDIIMQPARLTAEAASARFARQRDLQGAGLRRVAHAGIGAAPYFTVRVVALAPAAGVPVRVPSNSLR